MGGEEGAFICCGNGNDTAGPSTEEEEEEAIAVAAANSGMGTGAAAVVAVFVIPAVKDAVLAAAATPVEAGRVVMAKGCNKAVRWILLW